MLIKIKIAGTLLCAMCFWLIGACQVSAETDETQVLAKIGGAVSAVAIWGDVGYIGEGTQLTILDLRDIDHPRELRSIPLDDKVRAIEIVDRRAYVLLEGAGIKVFDLSAPHAPQLLSHFQSIINFYQIKRGGDLLYALAPAEGDEFGSQTQSIYIFDSKKQPQLELIGTWTVPFRTQDSYYESVGNTLVEQGNYIYLTTQTGLAVVDKTVLNEYRQVAFLPIDAKVYARSAIEIFGNYAFIRENSFTYPSIFRIIDISIPTHPIDLGYFKTPSEFNARGIRFIEHFALVTGYDYIPLGKNASEKVRNDSVDVYDIRDLQQPVTIKRLRNLAAPENFATCPFKGGCQYKITHAIYNLALSGNRVIVSSEDGVDVFAFSSASSDKLSRTAFFSTQYASYDKVNRVDVMPESNLYAVIDANSIQLVDFSNPDQPLRKVGYTAPADHVITRHWIQTDALYVVTAVTQPNSERYQLEYLTSTLSLFSIELDATFAPLGQIALAEPTTSIVVVSDFAYVASKNKFFVINVKSRHLPKIIASVKISDTDQISDLKADPNRLIVLIERQTDFAVSHLFLYSLSNPQQPVLIGDVVFNDPPAPLNFDAINLVDDSLVVGIRGKSQPVGGFDPPPNPTAVVILNIQTLTQPVLVTRAALNIPLRVYFETIATHERLSLLSSQQFIYAFGWRNYVLKKDTASRLIPVEIGEIIGKPLWVISNPTHEVMIAVKAGQLQFAQLKLAPKSIFLPLVF